MSSVGDNILNGGKYGIEASIITTAVLVAAAIALIVFNIRKPERGWSNAIIILSERSLSSENKQDNNFSDKINNNKNNINAFRSTLSKKQTLKPIKQNNGTDFLIDRTHYSNGSSTSGGTHSSKENTCYPFKLIVKDDNKDIRSLNNNKIKIKPIKK